MSSAPFLEWRLSVYGIEPSVERKDLGDRIRKKISQSAYHAVRRIACDVRDGRLTLRGRLPAYLIRQVSQLIFEELSNSAETRQAPDLASTEA